MQQQITKGDVLSRLAGISFIVGAIVLVVFGILHPQVDDRTDIPAVIQKIADTNGGFWEADHLLIAVGYWALMIGVVGVYRSVSVGGAAAWARLGFYGVIVGTTLWSVLMALDGVGLAVVAEQWEEATGADKATLLLAATSLDGFLDGMRSIVSIVYWLALVFLGIGMALSTVYPKWLGGAIVLVGATMVVVGFLLGLTGISDPLLIVFIVSSLLTFLWALVTGIWIARKAW